MKILNFSKKILLAASVACMFICCALAFGGKSAKAADKITDGATVVAEEYPSLKINEDGGIRFVLKMNAAAKNYLTENDDISLIAYIGPVKLFDKTDDEIRANAIKLALDKSKFYRITSDGDNWYANACVVKTKEANRAVDYTVKAFIETADGTVLKTYAAGENARGNVYNIATRALLDSKADYTEAILAIENYKWLGSEEFPIRINTIERYNELVAKINGGANLADKYVAIRSDIKTEDGTALSDGKTLPQNSYKVSYVTFASETGETLKSVLVKNGTEAVYDGETPVKADDDDYAYAFDKWVTAKGGDTAADLTNISGDITVYASFKAKGKNNITDFAVTDINYGETPSFTATAKNGTPAVTFCKTEDGTFVAWTELDNRDAGVYFAKAYVAETQAYAGAEEVKSFNVKKLTDNAITFDVAGEIACNRKFEPTATAKYGTAVVLYSEAQDGEFKAITSAVFEKGKTYYVKATVEETVNYNGAETEVKSVLIKDHSYNENGKCTVCNAYNTQGVKYGYDETKGCYYVDDNKTLSVAEVRILPAYADETHGEKDVKYVASGAFQDNNNITKVVLPESVDSLEGNAFWGCGNLEYVSMMGVTDLNYASPYGGKGRNNNFRNCFKLKTVIVSTSLKTDVGQFGAAVGDVKEKILDFFVYGESGAPDLYTGAADANNLVSGRVFYKGDGDKCGQWSYNEDGSIKYTSHNFVDGVCRNCGLYNDEKTQGVTYGYDSTKDCYYVGNNATLKVSEVTILSAYNDGTHGEKAVTFVKNGAFSGNVNIKKVILPESVTQLDGNVFGQCGNLEYVSMIGIADMAFKNLGKSGIYAGEKEDVITNNNFINCGKLTVLIVGKKFNLYADGSGAQQFKMTDSKLSACINIYVEGSKDESSVNCAPSGNNELLTGNVFYKGDGDKCGQWSYNEDGSIKYTSHNYVDGACEKCGEAQSKSVTYAYDQTSKSYYVTGVKEGTAETELYIRAKYNDGTNGEAAVTFVKNSAFSGNKNIKKVVLPATVTTLDGRSFAYCTNLEYISMVGVKALQAAKQDRDIYNGEEMYTTQNFLDCKSLATIIVGAEFADNGQQFTAHQETIVAVGNIYTMAATADGIKLSDNCPFLTKNVYLFSENKPTDTEHTYWHYVDGVATLWA